MRERFVATLTHDLRTPLSTAHLNLERFVQRIKAPEDVEKLRKILANLDRIDSMIAELLDANRIEAGEGLTLTLADVDLTAIARQILEEQKGIRGDRLVLDAPPELRGFWDAAALRRVIENLISNAVKYGERDTSVAIALQKTGSRVSLSVHNRGRPIAPEDQRHLFQPYHRTRSAQESHQGWGLGLTLVRGVAQAHHGSVEVESSADRGTTFTVQLPVDARGPKT
jgi:signal transduction histidine kinase